jgi:hypothetical protein
MDIRDDIGASLKMEMINPLILGPSLGKTMMNKWMEWGTLFSGRPKLLTTKLLLSLLDK